MEIKGLNLDDSPITTENKSIRYAENIEVSDNLKSYINERGLKFIDNLSFNQFIKTGTNVEESIQIIGVVTTNIGFILFIQDTILNLDTYTSELYELIVYIENINDTLIYKKVINGTFNFSQDRPIRGDYTRNYKGELIVTFGEGVADDANETRILNISNPTYSLIESIINSIYIELTTNQIEFIKLIPDLIYPTLNFEILNNGNLKTGSYQIAIRYKLPDNTYTKYSILHNSLSICGDYTEDYMVGINISRSIKVSFTAIDTKYEFYQLAIIYIDDDSQTVYQTDDISQVFNLNEYTISTTEQYNTISLDDIFVHNIDYIKDEAHVNFNNRLIRGNVKSVDYKVLDSSIKLLAENANVELIKEDLNTFLNKPIRYFQEGEVYSLYLAGFDYKGELVNIHKIPYKITDQTLPFGIGDIKDHQIPMFGESAPSIPNFIFYYGIKTPYYIEQFESDINTYQCQFKQIFKLDDEIKSDGNIKIEDYFVPKNVRYNTIEYVINEAIGQGTGFDNPSFVESGTKLIKITNLTTVDQTINLKTSATYKAPSDIQHPVAEIGLAVLQLKDFDESNIDVDETLEFEDCLFRNESPIWLDDIKVFSTDIPQTFNYNIILEAGKIGYYYIAYSTILAYLSEHIEKYPNINNFNYDQLEDLTFNINDIFETPVAISKLTGEDPTPNWNKYLININIKPVILSLVNSGLKSISVLFVEHDNNNARILSQSPYVLDMALSDFGDSQTYKGPFGSRDTARVYPYSYLFNKTIDFSAKIQLLYTIPFGAPYQIVDNYNDHVPHNINVITNNDGSQWDIGAALSTIKLSAKHNLTSHIDKGISPLESFEYIQLNNSTLSNTAGESFYRMTPKTSTPPTYMMFVNTPYNGTEPSRYGYENSSHSSMGIINLINTVDNLYINEFNQKLQIASSLYPIINNNELNIPLVGDTYLSYFTFKATAPNSKYKFGDAMMGSNRAVWRWTITVPIESKLNLLARYSANQIDKALKEFNSTSNAQRFAIYRLPYTTDNYINTSVGKGYSFTYNENGIQTYIYYQNLSTINHHIARLIRSDVFNTESDILSWRYFKPDDYKDIPNNRGAIVSLKTDNRNLYIQQQYGLRLATLRDKLANTEEGASYLGSSDLFDREPDEILYSENGYIGCNSYYDTDININGYYVIDQERGKIFQIYGNQAKEISSIQSKEWFENNLIKLIKNNPFTNSGRYIIYNETNNTLYIVQQVDKIFNISFKAVVSKWVSFHKYIPLISINNRNNFIHFNNKEVYFTNKFMFGRYFKENGIQVIKDSIIKICLNSNVNVNKLLNNIVWKDVVSNVDNPNIPKIIWDRTFNRIAVHNEDQATGFSDVNKAQFWYDFTTGVNKINIWKFNKIEDIAIDNDFLEDYVKFKEDHLDHRRKWFQRNKIVSQFVYAILAFDNTNNLSHEICDIEAEWIPDNRNNE